MDMQYVFNYQSRDMNTKSLAPGIYIISDWYVCKFNSLVVVMFLFCFGCLQNPVRPV